MANYDYIIVGGGSSGCVMANRLSEDPSKSVLLIESGANDKNPWIHIPATFFKVVEQGDAVHFYQGPTDEKLNNRDSVVLQGNVIGGGSSVNAMLYVRGQAEDYDEWASLGNEGWSYKDVLPVYKDLENNMEFADEYHGNSGELRVSETGYHHPLCRAFIRAGQQAGIKPNADFNGADQEGVGFYQTTTHEGRRWSSAQAFLRPAEGRSNLTIRTNTRVARITFDGKVASGVELEDGSKISASKEVVMCAGAIETPRLLQLSGIGDQALLESHGINVVSNLPGVGENYQDHLEVNVQCYAKKPVSFYKQDKGFKAAMHMLQYQMFKTGLLTSNVVECGGFIDVSNVGRPDVQFHVLPFMAGWVDREPIEEHGLTINPCFLRPKSRGSVKITSADPKQPALFDTRSLAEQEDVDVLVRGVKKAIEIFRAPAMQEVMGEFALPTPDKCDDDVAIEDFVRQTAKTVYHPVGTAKMGPDSDPMAVVDSQLKVKGVEGLRVADVSIMPTLVSGNTNAPAMMIAEKASRFILGR